MKNAVSHSIVLIGALIIAGCASTKTSPEAASGIGLDQLLLRMPPRDSIEARWINSSLSGMGTETVIEICRRLDRPGTERTVQAEYALQGLATYVSAPGREADRKMFVRAVSKAMEGNNNPEQLAFLIGRLQLAGKDESISVLARYLKDERLSAPAAQAMVAIGDGAEAAFLSALPESHGKARLTILKSLGDLRSRWAVETLLKESASDNSQVRLGALHSLGNIGDPRAESILAKAAKEGPESERTDATSDYLLFARRRVEAGDSSRARSIAKELSTAKNAPPQIRAAALDLMVQLRGETALDDLIGAMSDTSREVRSAALALALHIQGISATKRWIAALDNPTSRAEIIAMLGRRGDESAYPAVSSALSDTDPDVRASAVESAVRLKKEESVPALLTLLERSTETSDIAAVRAALERLPAGHIDPMIASSLSRVTPPACVMLLDHLGRYAECSSEPVFTVATSPDPHVHIAALKALGGVGKETDVPRIVALLLTSKSESERAATQKSLVSVCARVPDREKRAEPMLAAYGGATPEQRASLIRVIGRLGGSKSLSLVSGEMRSKDPEMRDAAVRALSDWPTIEAYDTLLAVAKSKEKLNLRVLALRGAVRVVENAPIGPEAAVIYHERTLAAAERPDEKRLAIGALSNIRSRAALRAVIPYISDDSIGVDAAMAAGKIARGESESKNELSSPQIARTFIESMAPQKFRSRLERSFDAAFGMNEPPEGFRALFNGRNLDGWKGLVENPIVRAKMTPEELARAQGRADSSMRAHWSVSDGVLLFDGKGESLCTLKDYTNFEMMVDWKIEKNGDSGIYLRGSPQVQIWDVAQWPEGSGGLYNNQKNPSHPLLRADRPIGEWNTFRIRMVGERVSVWLNGVMVVDSVVLENYWDRSIPIFTTGQIELQSHNSPLYFRNIFIRELPSTKSLWAGSLFNGGDLTGWKIIGGKEGTWGVDGGILYTTGEGGGWLSSEREYDNFELDLDFRLPEGGNSGVFLRSPHQGDPAYTGMEVQVLDDYASVYAKLQSWQYCGSIYGVQAPALRASKKAHEWQHYHIVALGPHVSVTLNGQLIVDADLLTHMDLESTHPGLKRRSGYIGLQSHTDRVEFRNITLKELEWKETNDQH